MLFRILYPIPSSSAEPLTTLILTKPGDSCEPFTEYWRRALQQMRDDKPFFQLSLNRMCVLLEGQLWYSLTSRIAESIRTYTHGHISEGKPTLYVVDAIYPTAVSCRVSFVPSTPMKPHQTHLVNGIGLSMWSYTEEPTPEDLADLITVLDTLGSMAWPSPQSKEGSRGN